MFGADVCDYIARLWGSIVTLVPGTFKRFDFLMNSLMSVEIALVVERHATVGK